MSRISEQSQPLWERSSRLRGHKSSINKALKAHRQQVHDRNDRVLSSQKTGGQFFPRAMRPESSGGSQSSAPQQSSSSSSKKDMSEIYNEYPSQPVRDLAPVLVENESEVSGNDVSPRRSIDYIV